MGNPTPVFFWHAEDKNGYLGQWFESPFVREGIRYETAEHWMMVQKAKLFGDEEIARQMAATTDAREHKALGRKVKGFHGGFWDEHKNRIVEEGNYLKFTASEDADALREKLLATGDGEIVEASSSDKIWGVGFAEIDAEENRHRWGQNLLGKALMNVRKRLREESIPKNEVSEQ